MTIAGETRLDQTLAPSGARGDRPLYVQQDLRLAAGAYLIDVDFRPLLPKTAPQDASAVAVAGAAGTQPRQPRRLVLQARIQIAPNQITLINYDNQAEALVVVERRE